LAPAFFYAAEGWAAQEGAAPTGATLWQLISAGGVCMIFLGLLSVAVLASILYHFQKVRKDRLVPQDLVDNLVFVLEKKEYDKAQRVCRQQPNLISEITLKGLSKREKGAALVEQAMQYEGRTRIERLWQNLSYLGDMAVIAPLLGLLGTILGMIDAFHYFKAGAVHPAVLTQGLAKAMVNTAFGLVIAVPALAFYAYFRGRISQITSAAESASAELAHAIISKR